MNASSKWTIGGLGIGELLITLCRLQLGGWMIVNGLNHWFRIFPQPLGSEPVAQQLLVALIESGLFGVVKAAEVVGGVMLLFDLCTPLALVMLMPVSVVVYYFNAILQMRWDRLLYMGVLCMYLNVILLVAYLRYYLRMLSLRAPVGSWQDLKQIPAALAGRWRATETSGR